MYKIISFLQNSSSGKMVLGLFILTNLVYGAIFGYTIPLVLSFAPDSILFDMSPTGYSYNQAIQLLESLGAEGRYAYLTIQIPLDFVYPAMFAASYTLLLVWFFKRCLPVDSKLYLLTLVPVLAGLSDYLENFGIVAMLNNYPTVSEGLVRTTSVFTVAKSGFTTIYFVILLITLIFLIKKLLAKR
ncbi:hypothetical protein [Photobacterium alginatilyticum]|uniref:Uncharacterized protein n=1 Tax=Photobacterium alginatilyticum TaxID=1775171 RepID=A0ABW9YI63_9GAMM|nr:hypothetical protein [Photobacterium alginatilyticum]NBI53512.1 hypothetical protein [Photobacterium alginatilyticum]